MENVKLVERMTILPEQHPTTGRRSRRIFLSNMDHSLITYQETVDFFHPPSNRMSFSDCCHKLRHQLGRLLVDYDFFAGRLVQSTEDDRRFEIDCNGAGVLFATAKSQTELAQLGDHITPNPLLQQFVAFVRPEDAQGMAIIDLPLLCIQFTQLKCGSLAFVTRYNHCVLDGIAMRESEFNMAALTRGEDLVIRPNPDRSIFKARNPPLINHPHYEYSKATDSYNLYTVLWKKNIHIRDQYNKNYAMYMSAEQIERLKRAILGEDKLRKCTHFEAVATKIWKARSIAMGMEDEQVSTILFPVDIRKRVVPEVPRGFAGNALVPGFARGRVRELKDEEDYVTVKKIREGVERLNDEYVRSSIDWLEVNKGVRCNEHSFSLVSWWRLGSEDKLEFGWGKVVCSTPIENKPSLVVLLPESQQKGGLNICLEMRPDQFEKFQALMMEC